MKRMKTVRAWAFVDKQGRVVPYHNEPVVFRQKPQRTHPWRAWLQPDCNGDVCKLVRVEIREVTPATRKRGRKAKR